LRKISQSPRFPRRTEREPAAPDRLSPSEPPNDRSNQTSDESPPAAPASSASFTRAATYAGLGFQFVAAILLCLYAGQWIDRKLGTKPLFLILGVFLGAGAAFYSMYQRLMADQKREDESRRE
jgi:F0F1-type ATP synthase assembly protein I